jgi:hypothetical protein
MRKIPTLFRRDENDRRYVTREVNPDCRWVLDGEGVATRKLDGTCCLVEGGTFFKRYEVKKGKSAPAGFVPANDVDAETGKQAGWVPVGEGPDDRYHREAWDAWQSGHGTVSPDGTYELLGPKVQGNPESYPAHALVSHATGTGFDADVPEPTRDFDGLRDWLLTVAASQGFEGIVWHHSDGRMAKLKRRDFAPPAA